MKLRELLRSDFANYIRPMIISDKCEICGNKEDLHLHHSSKRFTDILGETLEFLSLNENDNEDYSEKDIKIIRNMMLAEQIKISYNTLCKRCHMDAHKKRILLPSGKTKALKYKTGFCHHLDDVGSFYFLNLDNCLNKDNLFRFCYLLSFADRNGYVLLDDTITNAKRSVITENGKRMISKNIYCKKSDLKYIFNISRNRLYETVKYFLDNNMIEIESETKYVKISNKYYRRGGYIISNDITKEANGYIRIFDNSIKNIYSSQSNSQHSKLDVLIKLSKYMHINYNIACNDINGNTIEHIKFYTVYKLAKIFGYGKTLDFKNIIFDLKIKDQMVIKVLNINGNDTIIVNPELYYKGNSLNDILKCQEYFNNNEVCCHE